MPFLCPRKKEKTLKVNTIKAFNIYQVPRTGLEPAHPCECCHLKAVRLPISPPGLL